MKNKETAQGRTKQRARRDESGVALVLALLFVVLLTALVVDFAYEIQVDASLVESFTSDTEAYMAAKSGIATSLGTLAADLFFADEEVAATDADYYDSLDEPWADDPPIVPLNDAVVTATITDEYAKINLNAMIVNANGTGNATEFRQVVDAVRYIFELRAMDTNPVGAIIDWLDTDDDVHPEAGAENSYYEALETPYRCKNGPMDSIEELLLIPGITPEVYYGEDDSGQPALPELFTVHGDVEGRVNVNTAQPLVLEAIFAAEGRAADPAGQADAVIQQREEYGPFTSESELQAFDLYPPPPPEPNQQDQNQNQPVPADPQDPVMVTVASEVFRIVSDGQSGEASVRIEAYVWRDADAGSDEGSSQLFRVLDWRVIR